MYTSVLKNLITKRKLWALASKKNGFEPVYFLWALCNRWSRRTCRGGNFDITNKLPPKVFWEPHHERETCAWIRSFSYIFYGLQLWNGHLKLVGLKSDGTNPLNGIYGIYSKQKVPRHFQIESSFTFPDSRIYCYRTARRFPGLMIYGR